MRVRELKENKIFNSILFFIIFIFSFLFLTLIFQIITSELNFYNISFSITISLITFVICILLPKKIGRIFYLSIYIIFLIISISQILHYKMLDSFYRLGDIGLLKEGNAYINSVLSNINIYIIGYIVVSLFLMFFTIRLFNKTNTRNNKYIYLISIIILLISFYIRNINTYLINAEKGIQTPYLNIMNKSEYYNTYIDKVKAMEISGLYEYTIRDIYKFI